MFFFQTKRCSKRHIYVNTTWGMLDRQRGEPWVFLTSIDNQHTPLLVFVINKTHYCFYQKSWFKLYSELNPYQACFLNQTSAMLVCVYIYPQWASGISKAQHRGPTGPETLVLYKINNLNLNHNLNLNLISNQPKIMPSLANLNSRLA